MNAIAPDNRTGKPSTLDEAALAFTATLKFPAMLERHRSAILTLRARGASILQIHEILKEYNVLSSEWAISRFCRKYRTEWQRLQMGLDQVAASVPTPKPTLPIPAVKPEPVASPTFTSPQSTSNPTASSSHKPRDLRGDF